MFQKYKLVIPAILLLALSVWTFIGSEYSVNIQHVLGLVAAVLCIVSFFTFKTYYKYVLGTTLFLGLINLFSFTPGKTSVGFQIGDIGIGFQPYAFLVIILTAILAMPKRTEVLAVNSETISKLHEQQFNEDLEKFKTAFSTKSSTDLEAIIESEKYTAAAKEAAKLILEERK